MKKLVGLVVALVVLALIAPANAKIGVLVVAHGGSEDWNTVVERQFSETQIPFPKEIAFLEFEKTKTIERGIEVLEDKGCNRIVIAPLFISSYSGHIDEIRKIIGVGDCKENVSTIKTEAKIILTEAIDEDVIPFIVADRVNEVNGSSNAIVLVAHGTKPEDDLEEAYLKQWKRNLESICSRVESLTGLKCDYGFMHGEPNIRATVSKYENPVVAPIFIAEGYFTKKKIPEMLEGLNYTITKPLLPHPLISKLIEEGVFEAVSPAVPIKENGKIKIVRFEGVRDYIGKNCMGSLIVFKFVELATLKFGILNSSEVSVVSYWDCPHINMTFDYLLKVRNKYKVQKPEELKFELMYGNKKIVASAKVPDKFYILREKKHLGNITMEELKEFMKIKEDTFSVMDENPEKIFNYYIESVQDKVYTPMRYYEVGKMNTITQEIRI